MGRSFGTGSRHPSEPNPALPSWQRRARLAQHPWVPAGGQVWGLSFGGADSAGRGAAALHSWRSSTAAATSAPFRGAGLPGGQAGRWGESVPPGSPRGSLGSPMVWCWHRGSCSAHRQLCGGVPRALGAGRGFSFPLGNGVRSLQPPPPHQERPLLMLWWRLGLSQCPRGLCPSWAHRGCAPVPCREMLLAKPLAWS